MAIRKSSNSGTPKGATANRPANPSVGDTFNNGTLGVEEIYTASGWVVKNATPAVPTIGTATDLGSGRAYGATGAAATVAFTAGSGGGLPSTYTVNASTGSISATGTSSPITVTGLTPGTNYTFTVSGTNNFGTSPSSGNSNQITATTVPQAPTIGTPTNITGINYGGTTQISVPFTAGATGGTSITNYKYSTDGTTYTAFSPAQTTSPLTISGLTAGSATTVYIKAVNANGDSLTSSQSSSVTPATKPQITVSGAPTILSPTQVSIPFTINNGGASVTSVTVTSSPSISLTYSGTSSPITVTGQFVNNTSYTFTITATNSAGTSSSSTTSSVIPLQLVTLTSGSSYTVPSGITTIEAYAVGGGGGPSYGYGGGGGGGGVAYRQFSVTPGQVLTYSIGGGGSIAYPSQSTDGGDGSSTSLTVGGTTITGYGGAGARHYGSSSVGKSGGSGGGGAINTVGGSATRGTGGTAHYGNIGGDGGSVVPKSPNDSGCGSGGGAGSAGVKGRGGDGMQFFGQSTYYAWGGSGHGHNTNPGLGLGGQNPSPANSGGGGHSDSSSAGGASGVIVMLLK